MFPFETQLLELTENLINHYWTLFLNIITNTTIYNIASLIVENLCIMGTAATNTSESYPMARLPFMLMFEVTSFFVKE